MSVDSGLEQFVLDTVPHDATLASAVMQYIAGIHGVACQRLNRRITLLTLDGEQVTFHQMNGPDTSSAGSRITTRHHLCRTILQFHNVSVPRWAVFTPSRKGAAQGFARGLGAPIRVASAVQSYAVGPTLREGSFADQWAAASRMSQIMVEELIQGQRFRVFVVDRDAVAVTAFTMPRPVHRRLQHQLQEFAGLSDVTDEVADSVTDVAIAAVDAVPGFPYGAVDVVVPDNATSNNPTCQPVVIWMSHAAEPVAHFPTHGRPRDVAGAILEYYFRNSRWLRARNRPHTTAVPGKGAAVEPLFIIQGGEGP